MITDKITICTPTYNRATLLRRAFNSLLTQTSKNFIWLIIDDGSTDETEAVVNELIQMADFPVEYYKKINGGKHTALNFSYDLIRTEYVINLDSDDELTNDAIERILQIIKNLPHDNNRFWQISGRCIDSCTHKLEGIPYPPNINELFGKKQLKKFCKITGEKSNCRKVEILKKYPFPVYEDTKFVTENTVWEKIQREYDSYCVNDIFRIYHKDSSDSLAKGKTHSESRMNSRFHYSLFCINELFDEISYNANVRRSIINVTRSAMCSNIPYKRVMSELLDGKRRIIVTLFGYPLGFLYMLIKKEVKYL